VVLRMTLASVGCGRALQHRHVPSFFLPNSSIAPRLRAVTSEFGRLIGDSSGRVWVVAHTLCAVAHARRPEPGPRVGAPAIGFFRPMVRTRTK